MSLKPFMIERVVVLEKPLEYIRLNVKIDAAPLVCGHCGGQHGSESCSLKKYIKPTGYRFASAEEEKTRAAARDAIAIAAIDWVEDTGSCHFCNYDEADLATHSDDCPVGEYLKLGGA